MKTLALLTTSDHLQAPEPDLLGGHEALSLHRRFINEETPQVAGNDDGPLKALTDTMGFRLACSSVVRWYHGGINE